MTAAARMDTQLADAFDSIALGLDRAGRAVSDLDEDARAFLLGRLRLLAGDVDALLAEARVSCHAEPAESH